jgi:hypothetical protein
LLGREVHEYSDIPLGPDYRAQTIAVMRYSVVEFEYLYRLRNGILEGAGGK